jgi:hypothetical protein
MATDSLVIGDNKVSTDAMVEKVRKDIAFLNAKILYVEGQRKPNSEVLKTYKAMLESRYSVLEWLESSHSQAIA